jgi:two-component system, OmpR family, phosphate regulon response regulator OmpR
MNIRLLVVEPDQAVRDELRAHFQREQIEMSVLYSPAALVRRVELELPSAIVIRAEFPLSEFHLALRNLRAAGYDMPVMVVSKSADVIDKIIAFELGADDYMVEPFDVRELTARIRNALRRRSSIVYAAPEIRDRYTFDDWEIDFATRRLIKDGEDIGLRSSEFALLKMFAANPLKIMSRTSIIALLGKHDTGQTERGLDVLVFRLRAVIEPDPAKPKYIQTLRGRGYVFVPSGDASETGNAHEARSGHLEPQRLRVSAERGRIHEAWA